MNQSKDKPFLFPRWANYLLPAAVILIVGAGVYIPFVVALVGSPETTDVGYAPEQPIPFSHALHVGRLGMDCRYCHTTAETGAIAGLPPTQTCMNCHANIKADSPALAPLRESYETGMPIEWKKVHDLPDHAYFNHSAHVNKGIGCTTCHGPIHEMEVVRQIQPLSMAWCLDCHRSPEKHVRPRDAVTSTDWDVLLRAGLPQGELGPTLAKEHRIESVRSMEGCAKCHR